MPGKIMPVSRILRIFAAFAGAFVIFSGVLADEAAPQAEQKIEVNLSDEDLANFDKGQAEHEKLKEEEDASKANPYEKVEISNSSKNTGGSRTVSFDQTEKPLGDGDKSDTGASDAERNPQKLQDLKDNARDMQKNLMAERAISGASTAAMGIGAMQLAQGITEKKIDAESEKEMKLYLDTFSCQVSGQSSVRGGTLGVKVYDGDTVELDLLREEMMNLAEQLRLDKEALGMMPGIEANVAALDTSKLYNNASTGITSGHYTSISRALQNPEGDDAAEWAKQVQATKVRIGVGAGIAAAGLLTSVITHPLMQKYNKKTDRSAEILNKDYATAVQNFKSNPTQCPTGATGTPPSCNCGGLVATPIYNARTNTCHAVGADPDKCPTGATGTYPTCDCSALTATPIYSANTNTCEPATQDACISGPNLNTDRTDACVCKNGAFAYAPGSGCTCYAPNVVTDDICGPSDSLNPKDEINTIILGPNSFELGKAVITTSTKTELEAFAERLGKGAFNGCLQINGMTDWTGSQSGNQTLSRQRAEAAMRVLTDAGIPAANIQASGLGSSLCKPEPASGATPQNNEACRMVTATVSNSACTSPTPATANTSVTDANQVKKCPSQQIDCTKSKPFMNGRGTGAAIAWQACTDTPTGPKYDSCIITSCREGTLTPSPPSAKSVCVK
ncbi:MAG: OmpA family protein [Alphaproteobacteria bacterium]|nr:OmpA family protein [Alphaproteobacteria bacterium]